MNNIDEKLKSKAKNENIKTSSSYNKKVEDILKTLPRIKANKKHPRVAVIAVAITIITTVSAIAAPYIVELTGGVINYFKDSEDLKYISDKSILEKYNGEVGDSITENGITFTIDNIAMDDNFMNIFYTIKSEKDLKHYSKYLYDPTLEYKINGERVQPNNTYHTDSYFGSDNELKVMERLNISHVDVPETFELEISSGEIFGKKGSWDIALNVNMKEIKKNTDIVKPNIKATVSTGDRKHNINIEKVTMSPLGNQILISEKSDGRTSVFSMFALQDDNGKFIDVYPSTVAYGGPNGVARNSFEFANINTNTDYITIIPIVEDEAYVTNTMSEDISKNNIRLKQSKAGDIIIKNIDITDKSIVIDYKTEGVVPFIGGFALLNEKNERIKIDSLIEEKFDRETGIRTVIQTFSNSTPKKVSEIKRVGMQSQPFKLNYDEQIKVPLK